MGTVSTARPCTSGGVSSNKKCSSSVPRPLSLQKPTTNKQKRNLVAEVASVCTVPHGPKPGLASGCRPEVLHRPSVCASIWGFGHSPHEGPSSETWICVFKRGCPRFVPCPKAPGLSTSEVTASGEVRSESVCTADRGGVAGEPRCAGEPGGAPH